MRLFRLGIFAVAAQIAGAMVSTAQADCARIAAVGDGLTKDIAVVMSTHGLQNIIEGRGLKGQGEVKTTCQAGSFLTQCHSSQVACK